MGAVIEGHAVRYVVFRQRYVSLLFFGMVDCFFALTLFLIAFGALWPWADGGYNAVELLNGNVLPLDPDFLSTSNDPAKCIAWIFVLSGLVLSGSGLGMLFARRAARRLALAFRWAWLGVGGATFLAALIGVWMVREQFIEEMIQELGGDSLAPLMGGLALMALAAFLALVVLPVLFLAFYHQLQTRLTCEWRDPYPHWSEAYPVPLLVMMILFVMTAFFSLAVAMTGPIFPFFNIVLLEDRARFALMFNALMFFALAFGVFRRHPLGWWGALIYSTVVFALIVHCTIASFLWIYHNSISQEFGITILPSNRWDMFQRTVMTQSTLLASIHILMWLAFVVLSRRYFTRGSAPTPSAPDRRGRV